MLKAENAELKSDVKELKIQNSQQDDEILLLKNQILHLESFLPPKLATYNSNNKDNGALKNSAPPTKTLSGPPSSCQELIAGQRNLPTDGIHLLKIGNKIQAAFCTFNLESCSKSDSSLKSY